MRPCSENTNFLKNTLFRQQCSTMGERTSRLVSGTSCAIQIHRHSDEVMFRKHELFEKHHHCGTTVIQWKRRRFHGDLHTINLARTSNPFLVVRRFTQKVTPLKGGVFVSSVRGLGGAQCPKGKTDVHAVSFSELTIFEVTRETATCFVDQSAPACG